MPRPLATAGVGKKKATQPTKKKTAVASPPTPKKKLDNASEAEQQQHAPHHGADGDGSGRNLHVFYRGGQRNDELKEISHEVVLKGWSGAAKKGEKGVTDGGVVVRTSEGAKALLKIMMIVFSTKIFDGCKFVCNTGGRSKISLKDVVTYVNTSFPPDDQVEILEKIRNSVDSYRLHKSKRPAKTATTPASPKSKSPSVGGTGAKKASRK